MFKQKYLNLFLLAAVLLIFSFYILSCGQNPGGSLPNPPTPTTNPYVVVVLPSSNETNVAANSIVQVVFNRAMNPDTISSSTFTLTSTGGAKSGTITYNSSSYTATFTPSSNLSYSTNYNISLTQGIQDTSQLSLMPFTSSFVTGNYIDNFPPSVTDTSPEPNDTGVNYNASVQITFNEDINFSNITFQLISSEGGPLPGTIYPVSSKTMIFVLNTGVTLEFDTSYSAQVTAQDLAGNRMTAPYVFTFKAKGWTEKSIVGLGEDPQIVEADNKFHLGYRSVLVPLVNDAIYYNSKSVDSDSWGFSPIPAVIISTEDTDPLEYALVADDNGSEYIVYKKGTSEIEINYAKDDGLIFSDENILNEVNADDYGAIGADINDNGGLYIAYSVAYQGQPSKLFYINGSYYDDEQHFDNPKEEVANWGSRVKVKNNGDYVYIARTDNYSELRLNVKYQSDPWGGNYSISTQAGQDSISLDTDSNGNVFIAYHDKVDEKMMLYRGPVGGDPTSGNYYTIRDGVTTWEDDGDVYDVVNSMYIDEDDGIHIFYFDANYTTLRYAYHPDSTGNLSNGWLNYTIEEHTGGIDEVSITAHPSADSRIPYHKPHMVWEHDSVGAIYYKYMEK